MAAGVIIYEVPMLALALLLTALNGFFLFALGRYTIQVQADLIQLAKHVRQLTADKAPGEYQ